MKWLLIILFIPLISYSQGIAVKSFAKIVVNGTSSSGVTIDITPEVLTFKPIMNEPYKPITPNKTVTVTANLSFSENNIPLGSGGSVIFVLTGSWTVQLNGQVNNAIPATAGSYLRTISNSAGVYSWN
jgi:hypothetical protein